MLWKSQGEGCSGRGVLELRQALCPLFPEALMGGNCVVAEEGIEILEYLPAGGAGGSW